MDEVKDVVEEPNGVTMFEMQRQILMHFRTFFSQDTVHWFDAAYAQMEIMRLNGAIESRDKLITSLQSQLEAKEPNSDKGSDPKP